MNVKKILLLMVINFLILLVFSCSSSEKVNPLLVDPADSTSTPKKSFFALDRNDGWEISSAEDVDLDPNKLQSLIDHKSSGNYSKLHSIVIAKGGKLIFEKYYTGKTYYYNQDITFDWNTQHYAASTTKSINSVLIGIAFYNGLFKDINEKLKDFFPHRTDVNWEGLKGEITLKNMLTMSSGLDWDEWSYPFSDPRNSLGQFNNSTDPIGMVLNKKCIYTPGTQFAYNSGCSVVLGEMLRLKTGKNPEQFAKEYIFNHLKITNFNWGKFQNIVHTGGGLFMIPRDMAKIGQVFLNKGLWNGDRFFDENWVNESTISHMKPFSNTGYGYQWWIEKFNYNSEDITAHCAEGHGGQYICVIPKFDIVVVTTGGYYNSNPFPILKEIVQNYVFQAIK